MLRLLGLTTAVTAGPTAAAPTVHLAGLGTAEGVSRGGVDVFLGLPYAAPPLGQLRFREAAPPLPWSGTRDATRYGAPCLQNPSGDPNEFPDPEAPPPAEDCLFANVWRGGGGGGGGGNSTTATATATPANATKKKLLPVMLFIHGGGFCAGAGSEKWFDGTHLARPQAAASGGDGGGGGGGGGGEPHLVVTINYRLGALGFLVSNASGAGGMNGIADQIAALRWLQRHAAAFGADKDRVTVFGQSAGGMSVCVLSVSPRAKGLFSRALIESGPCVDPQGWGPGSAAAGVKSSAAVFAAHNATTLDELRAVKDASTLQWGDDDMGDFRFPGYFVDGDVAPAQPAERYAAYAAGNGSAGADAILNPGTMLVGVNSRDGTAQYYGEAPYATNASNGNYSSTMDARWGAAAAAVRAAYPLAQFNGSAQAAFVAADSDAVLACPTLQLAKALATARRNAADRGAQAAAATARVYMYQLSHYKAGIDVAGELAMVDAKDALHWASHGADLPFVFGHTSGPDLYWNTRIDVPFTPEEQRLSDTVRAYWTSFSATGKPEAGSGVEWPEFEVKGAAATATAATAQAAAVLDMETASLGGVSLLPGFKESECAFWESEAGQLAKAARAAPRAFSK